MTKKEMACRAVDTLSRQYPDAVCSLEAVDPFQLLVATRLSAQCTDARVNLVTPALFAAYPTPSAMAKATYEEVESYIRSCGLYKTKAKSLVELSKAICERFNGRVPGTMEELLTLPGIGRKTANLILGDIFHVPSSVVTDTHLIRIAYRIGLTDAKEPYKVEVQLRKILPPEGASDFCHRVVHFGRDICTARSPRCGECPMNDFCKKRNYKK